ncbi:MAG: DNA-methyltransferase [Candidatus Humimicrobiaceae bacterium]
MTQNITVNSIICGDCEDILKKYPDNYFDLIVTSPPYADSREKTYGGIKPENYVKWFLPKSDEFFRVLKNTGTFILNIKERVVNGERHTYVIELVLEMKKQGWLWTEEFIWYKKNCYPGKWPNRFRDSWERCLQFNKSKKFNMYQENVMVPIGEWSKSRLKNLSVVDRLRNESKTKSGFGKNISNWVERESVFPTNVLHLATECSFKDHSAPFPVELPEWFIKLFSQEGDLILDPFAGSGTTAIAAAKLGRNYLGIEILEEYCKIAKEKLDKIPLNIFNFNFQTIKK